MPGSRSHEAPPQALALHDARSFFERALAHGGGREWALTCGTRHGRRAARRCAWARGRGGNLRRSHGLGRCGRGRVVFRYRNRSYLRLMDGRWSRIFLQISGAFHLQPHQLRAHGNGVTHGAAQCQHLARHGRGNLHRGFVRHHISDGLVFGHHVARLYVPGHQFHFGDALANIGHADCVNSHGHASTARLSAAPTRSGPGK